MVPVSGDRCDRGAERRRILRAVDSDAVTRRDQSGETDPGAMTADGGPRPEAETSGPSSATPHPAGSPGSELPVLAPWTCVVCDHSSRVWPDRCPECGGDQFERTDRSGEHSTS